MTIELGYYQWAWWAHLEAHSWSARVFVSPL